ncbi:MAG: exosortase/archaeosortase family protein [Nanoarchaeota archaeon]|nr:exosortase/archaeosortase family protein [Nanoarchaeota archaeon]
MAGKQQKRYTKQQTKNTKIKILIFLIKLLILSIPIIFIVDFEWYSLQYFTASTASRVLNSINQNNVLFDTLSTSLSVSPAMYFNNGLIVVIDFACTGVRSFYLLTVILFSLEWNIKKQFKYLLSGGVILFFVNIFRITSVVLLVIYFNLPSLFENFLWTGMLNAAVLLLTFHYLKY